MHYPQKFLNSFSHSGLPSHSLMLKGDIPIMLLKNLNSPNMRNVVYKNVMGEYNRDDHSHRASSRIIFCGYSLFERI